MINKLALGFLMGASSALVFAQTDIQIPSNDGYSQDSQGTVTRSGYGLCWRSGTWSPSDAVAGCDGALKSPIPNPIAPEVKNSLASEPVVKSCDFSVTLANEQTFAFGKASLSQQAKKHIRDDVLPKLAQCKTVTSLVVTGHTDHIGAPSANQRLSEKRAIAVANYLKSRGIKESISTLGAGDSQPLVECSKNTSRAKIVSCLAPNRRVTIEVHGIQR